MARDAATDDVGRVRARLAAAGGGSIPWEEHRPLRLVDGTKADSVVGAHRLDARAGWWRSASSADDDGIGATVPWLGLTTAMAVRLAAQGRMVPAPSQDPAA